MKESETGLTCSTHEEAEGKRQLGSSDLDLSVSTAGKVGIVIFGVVVYADTTASQERTAYFFKVRVSTYHTTSCHASLGVLWCAGNTCS
jgi:hypothetical protein